MTDDAGLIERSWSEPAAFAGIFDRHFDAIHGYVARRLGRDAADDLAGEVFRLAFERRRSYDRSRASARPWLYGIALNVLRRHRRDQARRLRAYRASGAAEALPDPGDEVVAVVDARALRPALFAALSRIAPRDREPLLLHCWEGVSYAEIAEALGVPVGTVRSRINRARRRLRALLEPQRRLSPAARR